MILQRVFRGERRYQQIRDSIGASDSVLADRLKGMIEGGLLVKKPYRDGRVRYEYHLTAMGKATWRIFVAVHVWERQWLDPIPGPRPVLIHRVCGEQAAPELVCGKCDLPVRARETSAKRSRATLSYVGSAPRRHHTQQRTLLKSGNDPLALRSETLELLGDRWNTALASSAIIGIRRFSDFERFLGIPPTVLSARLSRFVELGILRVQELAGGKVRSDYRLTDRGRAMSGFLIEIVCWANEHLKADGAEVAIEIMHDACGRKLQPEYRCGHCGQRLRRQDVHFELGER